MSRSRNHNQFVFPLSSSSFLTAVALVVLLGFAPVRAENARVSTHTLDSLILIPEFRFEGDISKFALHGNEFFKERYLVESNVIMDIALLSYHLSYLIANFDIRSGMGYQAQEIIFDPLDINYGITPLLEQRFEWGLVHIGLEHRCYHEIDRREFATIYYNKALLGAGTPNFRLKDYWAGLNEEQEWSIRNRLQFYARWGYFVKEMLGWIKPVMVNGGNPRTQELTLATRFALARVGSWFIVTARAQTDFGGWELSEAETTVYWHQLFGVEAMITKSPTGGIVFLEYHLDELPLVQGKPRLSKNGLLQFGLRFFL